MHVVCIEKLATITLSLSLSTWIIYHVGNHRLLKHHWSLQKKKVLQRRRLKEMCFTEGES